MIQNLQFSYRDLDSKLKLKSEDPRENIILS